MSEQDDFDLLSVLGRSIRLWLRVPHVHLLMGVLIPIASLPSLGVLLGPLSVGYFRYLRRLSADERPPMSVLFSGFGKELPIAIRTGLILAWGTILGLLLGIVPGIVFLATFGFAVRSVADGALSARAALRASLEVARQRAGIVSQLYGFAFALQLFGLVSVVFVPLTNGLTAVVLSEGRERILI